jgi:hypothetical protein
VTLRYVASGAAILIGAAWMFRWLRFALAERFPAFTLGLLAVSAVTGVALALLLRRHPEAVGRLKRGIESDRQATRRPHGSLVRWMCGVFGLLFLAVALAGGWLVWSAPDLALFSLLWIVPSAYLAVTAFYVALTGKKDAYPDAFSLLWPW